MAAEVQQAGLFALHFTLDPQVQAGGLAAGVSGSAGLAPHSRWRLLAVGRGSLALSHSHSVSFVCFARARERERESSFESQSLKWESQNIVRKHPPQSCKLLSCVVFFVGAAARELCQSVRYQRGEASCHGRAPRSGANSGLLDTDLSCRGVALKKLLLFHHFSSRLLDCFEFCFSCESRSCAVCTFSPPMDYGPPTPTASRRAWNS